MTAYFVEKLTLRLWFLSVLPRLLWRWLTKAGKTDRCYVIDASSFSLLMATATAWTIGIPVEKLRFRLIDIRDEEGLLIRLRIAFQDLAEVQEEILKEPLFRDFVQREKPGDSLLMYLAKSIVTISLSDRGTLWRALLLVQICVWKVRKEESEKGETVLFLERRPWLQAIRDYAARYGVTIVDLRPAINVPVLARRILTPKGVAAARTLRNYLYDLRFTLYRKEKDAQRDISPLPRRSASAFANPERRRDPKVAVEYYGLLNLDQPEHYSNLFFWQQSALSGTDIVLTFAFPADPLDQKKWAQLAAHGMDPFVLHPTAVNIPNAPVFMHWTKLGRTRVQRSGLTLSKGSLEAKWLRKQVISYEVLWDYWRELFATKNIKIYVSWYNSGSAQSVMADALQSLGGVTVIYQRSYVALPTVETAIAADIVFGFSAMGAEVERCSNSIIRYYVTTGYLGDHRFPLLREMAWNVRNTLMQHGARRIVAFFDENSVDDSRWHTGHELQRVGYAFLLEKLLADPSLGLVLKPKVPSTLRRRLGPVGELLKRAEATGRCYLFEDGVVTGSYPPAAAALASDVAIHGHLCGGTAGLEAALAGVPTLLVDLEGWHVYPLYRLGVGRVVFSDWDELWKALMEHWANPDGILKFGDWRPMLNEIDPFRDGRAAERMGTYIKWLIDGFKAGLDRETVMADAAERYCELWGRDKVTAVDGRLRL